MAHLEHVHDWELTPAEAVALQQSLRTRVKLQPLTRPVRTVAGADISFDLGSETVYAGIVVLALPGLETVEEVGVTTRARFPYVPGLLSFREAPPLLEAWAGLRTEPDVVMLDGQGVAHPRRIGIASHLGLFLQRPTLGCAKSRLVGRFEEPGPERGDWSPLVDRGEPVGAALRTKRRTQPVYVSPGHLLDLPGALQLALACGAGYRVPEPTRRAHLFVNALRRAGHASSGSSPASVP
jgi:deoxyribonuclease V